MNSCRWCGKPAAEEREIAPAVLEPKTKKVKKRAVTVWVCSDHSAMIDRNLRCQELEKDIHRVDLKLRKLPPSDPKREQLDARRAKLHQELLVNRAA